MTNYYFRIFGLNGIGLHKIYIVSVLGKEEGYIVKYTTSPGGVPEGKAQGNS